MSKQSEEVRKTIQKVTDTIVRNAEGIRLVTMSTVKGEISRRVFQQGTATDGSQIGNYKQSTKKFRERAGRQTSKVDLELSGTLRGSLNVGVSEGRTVIGVAEQKEPKVSASGGRLRIKGIGNFDTVSNAAVQEKNFNKEIFAPSDTEIKKAQTTIVKEVDRLVRRALG